MPDANPNLKTKKEKARKVKEHADKAITLLETSKEIHQQAKQGLISEEEAMDLAIKLNEQASMEIDKALKLQKEDTQKD